MRKRLYKFSPDYKLKFSRILNALRLSAPAEGGWLLKVYETLVGLEHGNAFMNLNFTLA